jgi:NADH-quinone oxidoreductase subunit G
LDNGVGICAVVLGSVGSELQRISDVPIYFSDPLVRRAVALQQTRDAAAPTGRMCSSTLARIGVPDGAQIRVTQGTGEAILVAELDERVPTGCIQVAAAHSSTAMLGDMFGTIIVERA